MKYTAALSYILVALVASAAAKDGRQRGGFGGFGGGNNNNNNAGNNNNNAGNNNSAVSSAAASATTDAAASSTAAAGGAGGDAADEQDSLTLDPSVIATGFEQDGQATPAAGQVASLTSKNNFINFCLTVNKPITNGQQITTGSCNPAPMGVIAATTNMPSSKFVFPPNGATIQSNQEFTVQMAINNLETGNFVNAETNYYSAPQQVNSGGDIIGHSHVVIEQLAGGLDQTTPNDPTKFAFFKGINGAAVNGIVTADVTDGLPAGAYRMASINAAANHQPVLVAVAQHGSLDDMVYFTVSDNAGAANSTADAGAGDAAASTDAASTVAASTSASAAASSTAAAGGNGGKANGNNNNKGNQKANGGKGGFGFRFARELH